MDRIHGMEQRRELMMIMSRRNGSAAHDQDDIDHHEYSRRLMQQENHHPSAGHHNYVGSLIRDQESYYSSPFCSNVVISGGGSGSCSSGGGLLTRPSSQYQNNYNAAAASGSRGIPFHRNNIAPCRRHDQLLLPPSYPNNIDPAMTMRQTYYCSASATPTPTPTPTQSDHQSSATPPQYLPRPPVLLYSNSTGVRSTAPAILLQQQPTQTSDQHHHLNNVVTFMPQSHRTSDTVPMNMMVSRHKIQYGHEQEQAGYKKPRYQYQQTTSAAALALSNSLPPSVKVSNKKDIINVSQQQQQHHDHVPMDIIHHHPPPLLMRITPPPPPPPPPQSDRILALCTRRLINYTLKMQERPKDNNIQFWRNFVSEFYAEDAHTTWSWCVSSYPTNKLSGLPKQEAWRCGLCQIKPGRGFEIGGEALPRVYKVMYDNGTIKEQFIMENPSASAHDHRMMNNIIVFQCPKVKHETLFRNQCIIRKGRLCILFTPDFKICKWEFCAVQHREFVQRRDSILQIGNLSETAKNYGDAKNKSKLPAQQQKTSMGDIANSGNQSNKAKKTTLHDLGYEKQFVRVLQISEVLNYMKDLIKYSAKTGTTPRGTMPEFTSTFKMIYGSKDSDQQCERPNIAAEDDKIYMMQTSSPAPVTFHPSTSTRIDNYDQMNNNNIPGCVPLTDDDQVLPFAMAPSSRSSSCHGHGHGQPQEGASSASLASIAAKKLRIIDDDTTDQHVNSNTETDQLDSPKSVAKVFENSECSGHNNVSGNGNGVEIHTDYRGKEVIADNNRPGTPDQDFVQQLLFFLESDNARNITDF